MPDLQLYERAAGYENWRSGGKRSLMGPTRDRAGSAGGTAGWLFSLVHDVHHAGQRPRTERFAKRRHRTREFEVNAAAGQDVQQSSKERSEPARAGRSEQRNGDG